MRNIELKIDGEVIVLTSQQTAQLKRAVEKETSVPAPKSNGNMTMSCKTGGIKTSYPFVLSSSCLLPSGAKPTTSLTTDSSHKGRDFNQAELKRFITALRVYAKIIWPTFK